ESNSATLTFDGVDQMGERLAEEVMEVTKHWPEVSKISFIAHSLGGLVVRYAIGRLYENSSSEAKIVGLQPVNFITAATPHLGSRGHRQLPLLCGLSSALGSLKRRVAYANANYDRTEDIEGRSNLLSEDENYPHIVYVEPDRREAGEATQNGTPSSVSPEEFEEAMIKGLTQKSWERVDVSFQKSTQRYVAHSEELFDKF
ncbi:putative alpha/beta hydrolase, partial [Tanacetum coccineum]